MPYGVCAKFLDHDVWHSWTSRTAPVQRLWTSWGACTVTVGITWGLCDYFGWEWAKISQKLCGLQKAPVWCCLRWIYKLRCLCWLVGIYLHVKSYDSLCDVSKMFLKNLASTVRSYSDCTGTVHIWIFSHHTAYVTLNRSICYRGFTQVYVKNGC